MAWLVLGALFFVGIHLLISGTRLRDVLVARLGEGPYRGLFSVLSLIGIVWMSWAYNEAPTVLLWGRVEGLVPITMALVFLAFLIGVPGLLIRSPTAVGGETAGVGGGPDVRGILRVTRHPFLWGVMLWAAGHLIANGDVASLIFFGAFLVLAAVGQGQIDAKRSRQWGESWRSFAAVTSRAPFAAIAAGRNAFRLSEIGWWRIAVAIVLFVALMGLHPWLFDTMPHPMPG